MAASDPENSCNLHSLRLHGLCGHTLCQRLHPLKLPILEMTTQNKEAGCKWGRGDDPVDFR